MMPNLPFMMAFSIMTLSRMGLSLTLSISSILHNVMLNIAFFIFMLSVAFAIVMLSVIALNVVMPSVEAPNKQLPPLN
jgi:hypothetical protein